MGCIVYVENKSFGDNIVKKKKQNYKSTSGMLWRAEVDVALIRYESKMQELQAMVTGLSLMVFAFSLVITTMISIAETPTNIFGFSL